jgi:orotidine-5'-phosphate decarboxylase
VCCLVFAYNTDACVETSRADYLRKMRFVMIPFSEQVKERIEANRSVLCVGLDAAPQKIPACLQQEQDPQLVFNQAIIDATHDLVCCYKPNFAFYTVRGAAGMETLRQTIAYAHSYDVPVILDAKFGDIGHTAEFYAQTAFEVLQADSVTVNPYMGEDTIAPFRAYEDKGVIALCFTSNASRSDFQTRLVTDPTGEDRTLYLVVAEKIAKWNTCGNMGAVVGATAPEELEAIRAILGPSVPILCPGIGAQGGDLEEILWAGAGQEKSLIVNVSRAILNASPDADYAEAARREARMFVEQIQAFFSRVNEEIQ